MNISDVLKACCRSEETAKPNNTVIAIDTSFSTKTGGIIDKEKAYVERYILNHGKDKFELYSFDSIAKYYGFVECMADEGLVTLPHLVPQYKTYTHEVFDRILQCSKFDYIDIIIIITDGQSDSRAVQLIDGFDLLKKKYPKIRLEIVAISNSTQNLEYVSAMEEVKIPGMDLLKLLGNLIDSYIIYNRHHCDKPIVGSLKSTIDKDNLFFMGHPIKYGTLEFLDIFLSSICSADWKSDDAMFKRMLCEFGKLFSLIFINFPDRRHPLLTRIEDIFQTEEYSKDRIYAIISYGFRSTKNNVQIMMTSFNGHLRDESSKIRDFSIADDLLRASGTSLGSDVVISVPTIKHPLCCICGDLSIVNKSFHRYPNSMDERGNVYFGTNDVSSQGVRTALRKLWQSQGNTDWKGDSAMFMVANAMSMMFVNGIDIETKHMQLLRRLAIHQASKSVVVAPKKYDSKGCYDHWKCGKMVPMHYSDEKCHSSLYSDVRINFLGLSETMWWALMMSMLGIYKEQLHFYEKFGEEKDFLEYIRKTYSHRIEGRLVLQTIVVPKKSIFTLDCYDYDDEVYLLKDHGNCYSETWYSRFEIDMYVKNGGGCVWCHYLPIESDFERVTRELNVHVEPLKIVENCERSQRFKITMIGIPGSGKSTIAEKISREITRRGGTALILNADTLSKRNIVGKCMAMHMRMRFGEFEMIPSLLKVVIVDLCNETGPDDRIFGLDLSNYKNLNYFANFNGNDFSGYEAWCANNVLGRGMWSESTMFWLTPADVGVERCIAVHNKKAKKLARYLKIERVRDIGIEDVTEDAIERYKLCLKDDDAIEFLKTSVIDICYGF